MKTYITILLMLVGIKSITSQIPINSINCAAVGDKSVVSISTFSNGTLIGSGSGVLLSIDGKIVTNYHVYQGGNAIVVNHQGKTYNMREILVEDRDEDILIFTIGDVSSISNFSPIKLGNVNTLQKGEIVYAIGNTFGNYINDNRITQGILSTKPKAMIEFSASINFGNSGGALINADCELIGIVTLKHLKTDMIGYAIPIDKIKAAIQYSENNNNSFALPPTSPEQIIPKSKETQNGNALFFLRKGSLSNIYVYHNDEFLGVCNTLFDNNATPPCGEFGAVTKLFPIGVHNIQLFYGNKSFDEHNLLKEHKIEITQDSHCYAYPILIDTIPDLLENNPKSPKPETVERDNLFSSVKFKKVKVKHNVYANEVTGFTINFRMKVKSLLPDEFAYGSTIYVNDFNSDISSGFNGVLTMNEYKHTLTYSPIKTTKKKTTFMSLEIFVPYEEYMDMKDTTHFSFDLFLENSSSLIGRSRRYILQY